MALTEKIKEEVLRKANFRCCVCRSHPATHVHHIIPQKDSGPDTEDNAAPLCPNCHDTYGANPEKRRFIKRNRDDWYEICQNLYTPNNKLNQEILEHVKGLATKEDLDNAVQFIHGALINIIGQDTSTDIKMQQISDVTAAISSAIFETPFAICPQCGLRYDIDASTCPNCGWPEN